MRARLMVSALFLLAFVLFGGCAPATLLSDVSVSPEVITPNGDGDQDVATISYALTQPSVVSILLESDRGARYTFRKEEPRPPGRYNASFYGTLAAAENGDQRVIADGTYAVLVLVRSGDQTAEARATIRVQDADIRPPEFPEVQVLPNPFSPNGDALDDEVTITSRLSKEAQVLAYATDAQGQEYLIEPEKELSPAWHSFRWNGQAGGRLVPNGSYILHLRARDTAGNVTDYRAPLTVEGGGTPKLEILDVRIEPSAVPLGGQLTVTVQLKNSGDTVLRSLGPNPGTSYDTVNNFLQFADATGQPIYYERPGFWRIGVQWEQSASPYPVRWGWGDKPLNPGDAVTITGSIKVLITQVPRTTFWVNVVQEGVGFPQEPVGHKRITISY